MKQAQCSFERRVYTENDSQVMSGKTDGQEKRNQKLDGVSTFNFPAYLLYLFLKQDILKYFTI